MDDSTRLERAIGYTFKNKSLLHQALVHPSFTGEHKDVKHNQRLEYLGDAVFELSVSTLLYNAYPDVHEGELSKLRASIVSEEGLFTAAEKLRLGECISMSSGETAAGGPSKPSIVSDAMEAVMGAVYLDSDFPTAAKIIARIIGKLPQPDDVTDYKSRLQEKLQRNGSIDIIYTELEASGPPHDRSFVFAVTVNGKQLGRGAGKTKKQAQQAAARQALETSDD